MKNYDETINSVFGRINEYEIKKKRKRKTVTKIVTSLCCVCLVALFAIGVWQSDLLKTRTLTMLDGFKIGESSNSSLQETDNKNENDLNQSQHSITAPNENEGAIHTTDDKINNNNDVKYICHLNQIDGIASAASLYLDPATHYTKDWDNKQVADYLGVDLSNLGSVYKYAGNVNHTVTYSNSGNLVRDIVCFNYKYNEIEFTISASKLGVPYDCVYSLDEEKTTSVKAKNESVDVLFAATVGGNESQPENQKLLVADFQYNRVCYRVTAENVSVSVFCEFINCVLSK